MKKYFCDKCRMEMSEEQYYKRPYFCIRKYDTVNGNYCKDMVLCAECESKFIKWLGEIE